MLTGFQSAKSSNEPFFPISFLYTTIGKLTARIILLYIANPSTMPINVNWASVSNDVGLNLERTEHNIKNKKSTCKYNKIFFYSYTPKIKQKNKRIRRQIIKNLIKYV